MQESLELDILNSLSFSLNLVILDCAEIKI